MEKILIERLLKEREILLSSLNNFNVVSCQKKFDIDLHDFLGHTNKIIKAYSDKNEYEERLKRMNESLDSMLFDLFPEKSIKLVVNKNKNIFLN